jgi:hypothetical protein
MLHSYSGLPIVRFVLDLRGLALLKSSERSGHGNPACGKVCGRKAWLYPCPGKSSQLHLNEGDFAVRMWLINEALLTREILA